MTTGELRATVTDLLGPNNGLRPLSAPMVDELLLKAAYSVNKALLNWRTRGETSINVVASDASYDLPANCLFVESVVLVDGDGTATRILPIRIDEEKHQDFTSLTPGYYISAGSTDSLQAVNLLPTPSENVTNGLKVRYRKRPASPNTYAVTAEYDAVDPELHLALCHEAAYLFLERQGSKAAKDFADYRGYFQREIALARQVHDETRQPYFIPTIKADFGGFS